MDLSRLPLLLVACLFPVSTVGFNPTCIDRLSNCQQYGKFTCQEPYISWSKQNCASFCGFCGSGSVSTTNKPTVQGMSSACVDVLSNCKQYGSNACHSTYEKWARVNCAKYCGFCTEVSFTGPCEDSTFITCSDSHVCADDRLKTYCPITCGLCVPTTQPPCEDSTFIQCSDSHVCGDPNLKKYCPATCGLCVSTTQPPCEDSTFIQCSDSHVCGDPSLQTHCPATCGLCGVNPVIIGK